MNFRWVTATTLWTGAAFAVGAALTPAFEAQGPQHNRRYRQYSNEERYGLRIRNGVMLSAIALAGRLATTVDGSHRR